MMSKQTLKYCLTLIAASASLSCESVSADPKEIQLETSIGDNYVIEIQPNDSFIQVVGMINQCLAVAESQDVDPTQTRGTSRGDGFNMVVSKGGDIAVKGNKKPDSTTLDYNAPMTQQEKDDITYIVRTLANDNLLKIKSAESALKKAGDRVQNVHPLQFLGFIFSNEELIVCMRNMQGRAWVWKEFLAGNIGSLKNESLHDNVLPYAPAFAKRVNVDLNLILPTMQAGKWEKLVDLLIKYVPRKGDSNRYDM